MKWIVLLLCSLPALAGLADVKAVYMLPMAHGLDQYLANHLAKSGLCHVVTDAKRADTVFTDRIGETLESQLKDLYAAPKPAEQKKKVEPPAPGAGAGDVSGYAGAPPRASSFGGGKGNLFLVDVKSRTVIWSTHARPKNITPAQLDETARRVIESLNQTLHPKQK